jgi:hypothetical protein
MKLMQWSLRHQIRIKIFPYILDGYLTCIARTSDHKSIFTSDGDTLLQISTRAGKLIKNYGQRAGIIFTKFKISADRKYFLAQTTTNNDPHQAILLQLDTGQENTPFSQSSKFSLHEKFEFSPDSKHFVNLTPTQASSLYQATPTQATVHRISTFQKTLDIANGGSELPITYIKIYSKSLLFVVRNASPRATQLNRKIFLEQPSAIFFRTEFWLRICQP